MKNNWKENYLENLVDELNERIEELEKENERLRRKDKMNQEMMKSVRQVEYEYYKNLDELKATKEKCRKLILETRNLKQEYASKLNETIQNFKKKR